MISAANDKVHIYDLERQTMTRLTNTPGNDGNPKWSPDGSLVYASDHSDWWNLYRWRVGATGSSEIGPMESEIGGPQWVFGLSLPQQLPWPGSDQ